jgi:ureidoglycolate hydrolase
MTFLMQRSLVSQPITAESFQPYGQVIFAAEDGKTYDREDAQLLLGNGIPRLYIMRLHHRGRRFSHITRHQKCTQCLGSLEGQPWLLAVAPPCNLESPVLKAIAAFQVPGNCFVKLEVGTWHAGPYFDQNTVDFYNLELSDTNIADHDTCNLRKLYDIEFTIG